MPARRDEMNRMRNLRHLETVARGKDFPQHSRSATKASSASIKDIEMKTSIVLERSLTSQAHSSIKMYFSRQLAVSDY